MGKKIIVTGTPGSGKTTILSKLSRFTVVSLGTEIQNLTKQQVERDRIRSSLSNVNIKSLRAMALREIDARKEDLIIDTHTAIKAGNRYIAGLTAKDMKELHDVKAIIYVDATADDILLRRSMDKSRSRDLDTKQEIKEQRSINMSLATFYMQELEVPLYIIKNKQGKVESAAKEVQAAISDAMSRE